MADTRNPQPPPWEQRPPYSLVDAFVQTICEVMLEPRTFFSRLPVGLGHLQPVLFAVAVAVVAALLDWMWSLALGSLPLALFPGLGGVPRGPLVATGQLLLAPVIAVMAVYARAAVFHGILRLLGSGRLGFEATLRVVAYSRAAQLLVVVPILGPPVGMIWELALTVIGLARGHECQTWQAAVAVLAPAALLLLVLGSWALLLLGFAILA